MNEALGRVMAVTGSQMTVSLEVDHVDSDLARRIQRGRLLDEGLSGVEPGRAGAHDRDGQGGHS